MKVILEAWHLRSPVQEWPEGTGLKIKIPLIQPRVSIGDYYGKEMDAIPPREDIGEFEWTGASYMLPEGKTAKVYVLRRIL